MAFTHRITHVYQADAATVLNITENVSGTNQGVDIDDTIAPAVVTEYDVMICPDQIQSLMICANQPLMIQTNDAATPLQTITLKANVPLLWTINSWYPVPFTLGTDVTKLFVTNNGSADAAIDIRILSN